VTTLYATNTNNLNKLLQIIRLKINDFRYDLIQDSISFYCPTDFSIGGCKCMTTGLLPEPIVHKISSTSIM